LPLTLFFSSFLHLRKKKKKKKAWFPWPPPLLLLLPRTPSPQRYSSLWLW
jgi:hypothetical protein